MIVISPVSEMQSFALQSRLKGLRIGFVPTMGFLHDGHMALVRLARKMSDLVIVSSFVNPSQFGPGEDFDKYPRNAEQDDRFCEQEGVDVMFRPSPGEIYAKDYSVYVEETSLSAGLCGRFRPGHFRGVATIVAKLFNIAQPHVAVFGRKDAQQGRIIEQLTRDLNFPVEIILGPIVREPDGLAMSSRNVYLSESERRRAGGIYRALCAAERLYRDGARATAGIINEMRKIIDEVSRPDAIEYIEAVDYETLKPAAIIERAVLFAVALRIGRTRLIDNVLLPVLARG